MPEDGFAMFPTPDRNGVNPVQAFGIPVEDSALIAGADRNGVTVVAPVGVPVKDAPMIGVADRESERVGVTLGGITNDDPYIIYWKLVPTLGTMLLGSDDWSAGPKSDDFNRANGNPRSLPNYPWYGISGFGNASLVIDTQELYGTVVGGGSGSARWVDSAFLTPLEMQTTILAKNIVFAGNRMNMRGWEIGIKRGAVTEGRATLYADRLGGGAADPIRVWLEVQRGGLTNTSGFFYYANFPAFLGNPLKLYVSDGFNKASFLGITVSV